MIKNLLIILLVAFLLNIIPIYIYIDKNYIFDFKYNFNYFIKSYISMIWICFFGWALGYIVMCLANIDEENINKNIGLFLNINFSAIILLIILLIIDILASV